MIRVQVGISLDETVTSEDLDDLLFVLGAPSVVSYLLFYRVNHVIKQVLLLEIIVGWDRYQQSGVNEQMSK